MFDAKSFILSIEQEFDYIAMSNIIDRIEDPEKLKNMLKKSLKIEMVKQNLINDLLRQIHENI